MRGWVRFGVALLIGGCFSESPVVVVTATGDSGGATDGGEDSTRSTDSGTTSVSTLTTSGGRAETTAGDDPASETVAADDDPDSDTEADGGTTAGTTGSTSTGEERCPASVPPCDDDTADPLQALGATCPGSGFTASVEAPEGAVGARASFGGTTTFDPREGARYAVLSTGQADDIDAAPCSTNHGAGMAPLPSPMAVQPTAADCISEPAQVGTGDCSMSISNKMATDEEVFDAASIRVQGVVPAGATSLSVDVAYLTTDFPEFVNTTFEDLFVVWLESASWTGNVAFTGPIPLSASTGLLQYTDDDAEIAGTCLDGHGATAWLTITAPVTAGDTLELVLAVVDRGDATFDAIAFIDNLRFGCEDVAEPEMHVAD